MAGRCGAWWRGEFTRVGHRRALPWEPGAERSGVGASGAVGLAGRRQVSGAGGWAGLCWASEAVWDWAWRCRASENGGWVGWRRVCQHWCSPQRQPWQRWYHCHLL